MAIWQKEIMTLANDFCLNVSKAKEIVLATDKIDDFCNVRRENI